MSDNLKELWRRKSDKEVAEAAVHLSDYTDEARQVVKAEIRRRGLPEPPMNAKAGGRMDEKRSLRERFSRKGNVESEKKKHPSTQIKKTVKKRALGGSVVTYANNDRQCFCQIKFDSGERVLISIAGAPTPSIKIIRLAFGGLIPRQTIWEYNPVMAGGYDAYVRKLMKMFPPDPKGPIHPLDVIRDTLLPCSSIEEARLVLFERESRVTGASSGKRKHGFKRRKSDG